MTTTQFIEFLQQYEKGGATGRPREINFWMRTKKGSVKLELSDEISTGDGLVTDLGLYLDPQHNS